MQPLIIKILWTIIVLNIAALAIVTIFFLLSMSGRNVSSMETGWMAILFVVAVIVILLAAVPLRLSQSTLSLVVSGFFALLPLGIYLGNLISDHMPKLRRDETMAELYYKDPTQRGIAAAIEKGDPALVEQLIVGQDLNIQGNRVWDWDGLNYLQFAIRLRSNAGPAFQEKPNTAIIRLLIAQGSATTPALPEGIKCLPTELVALLLDAGADPNTQGFVNSDPLLFSAIGQTKLENDIAIQLIQKGASINAINADGLTPIMFAANNARTIESWTDTWRVIRYLLEEAHADYKYKRPDKLSFPIIIEGIRAKALEEKVTMPADFDAILKFLEAHA